tara:strand:+ start:280 stop:807 length:528 start_codon:yes stop_codon:yes gene_type:complete
MSPDFHTNLTTYGRAEAERLVPELHKLSLDYIYASPFVRTLETIEPFSRFKNIPIRLENSIYECIREPFFEPFDFQYGKQDILNNYPKLAEIIDLKYESMLPLEKVACSSDLKTVYDRIVPFINHLGTEIAKGHNILLVTHRTTFNIIEGYIANSRFIDEDPVWKPREGQIKQVI